jgi:hypothetical protein
MRQALEIRDLPPCKPPAIGWLGRLRIWLFGSGGHDKVAALRHCSPHLLRDIGLAEDVQSNHLLREHNLRR